MNKLKIGVLLKDYQPHEGGVSSYTNALIDGIISFNFHEDLEFVFVVIDGPAEVSFPKNCYFFDAEKSVSRKHSFFSVLNRIAKIKGINYLPVSAKIQASYQKKYYEEIKYKLIENGIDMVYSLSPFYSDLDYPAVITHWDIGHRSTYVLPEIVYNGEYMSRKWYYKNVLPKAFAIFCESEAGKKELCQYENINPQRVHVVPLFPGGIINLNLTKAEEGHILDKFELSEKEFFVYPAQFWPHKNHFNLIVAFKRFNEKYPGVKLLLSGGDKGNLIYIKQLVAELKLEGVVLFPGFISDSELYTFYKNAVSLVMPTLLGPTNMPPIEAQALGCRVICSDLAGHRESLGEGPTYIDPLDREGIFSAMEVHYLERDTYQAARAKYNTLTDALNAINIAFLSLSAIRKTFPKNFDAFRIFMAICICSLPHI